MMPFLTGTLGQDVLESFCVGATEFLQCCSKVGSRLIKNNADVYHLC